MAANPTPADEDQYLSSYYGEDIFDDLIEKALQSTSDHNDIDEGHLLDGGADADQIIEYDDYDEAEEEEENLPIDHNTTHARESNNIDDADNASVDIDDIEEGRGGEVGSDDASSLDSKEISGQSILSDVDIDTREMDKSYTPPPLINDDESTIDMRPPAPQIQTVSSFVEQLNKREKHKSKLFKASACALLVAIIVGVVIVVITLTGGNNDGDQMSSQELKSGQDASSSTSPTTSPVVVESTTTTPTIHLVQMTFQNVPTGYRISADDAASLGGFTTELLGDYVEDQYEVLEVAYARDYGNNMNNRILLVSSRELSSNISIPFRIVIQGPSTVSEDSVRSYIIDILYGQASNIVQFMKQLDWDSFNAVIGVTFDEYDLMDLVLPTQFPSLPPQTDNPTLPQILETGEPTATITFQTNAPTTSPSLNYIAPTSLPSEQPSITRTPRPAQRPTMIPTRLVTNKPMITTTNNGNNPANTPSAPAPTTPSGSSEDYFCAKISYTESWNILMDFNCELPCPSGVLDCPGGHQCQISDYCSTIGD